MSSDEHSDKECPLCMEPLEIDDINFYPCKCEYQICRFCWHRLRTDENGLCPACRQPYPEDPVNFKPLSASDVQKIKSEKRQRQQQQKIKICESRKHLSSYRVLQKNLVYVVGLSARVADPETLKKTEYFGKYGRIIKVAVGSTPSGNGPQSASCTAYVTYARFEDALRAIQAVNNAQLDGRIVKASLGTTKYCTSFLRSQPCHKQECMYLHDVADNEVSFTKDDMHLGRHAEYERKLIESTLKGRSQRRRPSFASNNRKESNNKGDDHSSGSRCTTDVGQEKSIRKRDQDSSSPTVCPTDATQKMAGNLSNGMGAANTPCSLIGEEKARDDVKNRTIDNEKENCSSDLTKMLSEFNSVDQLKRAVGSFDSFSLDEANKPRLSDWTLTGSRKCTRFETCESIERMLTNGIEEKNLEVDDMKQSPSSVSHTGAGTCNWQLALGIAKVSSPSDVPTKDDTVHKSDSQDVVSPASSPANVQSDDDLGFDPISESVKGLADLMEEEKSATPLSSVQSNNTGISAVTSSLMSMGLQCGWPSVSLFGNNPVKSADAGLSSSSSIYAYSNGTDYYTGHSPVKLGSPPDHTFAQQPSSFLSNQLPSQSCFPTTKVPQIPLRVGSFTGPVHCNSSYQQPLQRYPLYNSASQYVTNRLRSGAKTPFDGSKLHEWQEGFRALLPNVNVRFVSDLNPAGYLNNRTSPMEMQRPGVNYDPVQISGVGVAASSSVLPTGGTFSQSSQQWMMPPPGFSYMSKR